MRKDESKTLKGLISQKLYLEDEEDESVNGEV
jgi:hypothetical protein